MAKEIERKFIVVNDSYKAMAISAHHIRQGYLSVDKDATIRIRIKDNSAYLTIKGISVGAVRDEWEYPIPLADAKRMLNALSKGSIIEKIRYIVKHKDRIWEIDEFKGHHAGLVVAEIELKAEDDKFPLPCFIGEEVTGDVSYYNSSLAGI